MRANYEEAARETECSAALRYFLLFVLLVCVSTALLFGAVAVRSRALLQRPTRVIPLPLRLPIQHESTAAEAIRSDATGTADLENRREPEPGRAAALEQNLAPLTRYTVHVHMSGTDQFIPVTAPPGGLQLEVRDMTGDNVRNDVVLRPAVVHWPLIVLLNDGQDHFTVAISAALPSSLDSGSRASQARHVPESVAILSSASKGSPQARDGQALVPKFQKDFLTLSARNVKSRTDHISISGRAPPPIPTRI